MATTVAQLQAKIGLDTADVDQGVAKTQSALSGMGNMLTGALAGLSVGTIVSQVTELANLGQQAQKVATTFQNLGGSASGLAQLRAATKGTVTDTALMQSANKFLAMGLAETSAEAAKLTQMAVTLGTAMGGDAATSAADFAAMLANQSIPRLDNFGISSGKVRARIEELTAANKNLSRDQAFLTAVMGQGTVAMDKVAGKGGMVAGGMAQSAAGITNMKESLGKLVGVSGGPIDQIAGGIGRAATALSGYFEKQAAGNAKIAEFRASLEAAHAAGQLSELQYAAMSVGVFNLSAGWTAGKLSVDQLTAGLQATNMAVYNNMASIQAHTLAATSNSAALMAQLRAVEALPTAYSNSAMALSQLRAVEAQQTGTERAMGMAMQAQEVANALSAVVGVHAQHQTALLQLETQGAQGRMDAQFSFNLQRAQAEQQYQANHRALLAAGRTEDAAKLSQKFQNENQIATGNYQVQQQVQARSLLIQQIQQQRSYIAQLGVQRDAIVKSLVMQIQRLQQEGKIDETSAKAAIAIAVSKGSEQLKTEYKTAENSLKLAKSWADGQITAQEMVMTAMAEMQKAQFGAQKALDDLEEKLKGFTIEMPPVPPLDLSSIGDVGNVGAAAQSSAEAATVPAEQVVATAAENIAKGVESAKRAVAGLADFVIPETVEAGWVNFATFLGRGVDAVWQVYEGSREKFEQAKTLFEPINQMLDTATKATELLDKIKVPEKVPDLAAWGEQVAGVAVRLHDVLIWTRNTVGGESLKEAALLTSDFKSIFDLVTLDLSKVVVNARLPSLETWGQQLAAVAIRAKEVLLWTRNQVGRAALTEAAALVTEFKALFDLVGLDLNKVATNAQLPSLETWGQQLAAVAIRAKEVLLWTHDRVGADAFKEAAALSAQFKQITDLVGVDLSKVVVNAQLPSLETWGQQLAAIAIRAKEVLLWTRDQVGADALKAAADTAESFSKVMSIIGIDLSQMKLPTQLPDFGAWARATNNAVATVVDMVTRLRGFIGADTLKQAAEASGHFKQIMDLLGIDLSKATLPDVLPDFGAWARTMNNAAATVVDMVASLRRNIGTQTIKEAGEVAPALKSVMDLLGVDLAKVVPPPPNWDGFLAAYLASLESLAPRLIAFTQQLRARFTGEVIKEAAETSTQLKAVFDLLTLGDAMFKLRDFRVANLQVGLDNMVQALGMVVDGMVPALKTLRTRYAAGLAEAASTAESVKSLVSLIVDIPTAINEAMDAGGIDIQALGILMQQVRRAAEVIGVGGYSSMVTLPPEAPVGGENEGGTVMPMIFNFFLPNGTFLGAGTYTGEMNEAREFDIHLAEMVGV